MIPVAFESLRCLLSPHQISEFSHIYNPRYEFLNPIGTNCPIKISGYYILSLFIINNHLRIDLDVEREQRIRVLGLIEISSVDDERRILRRGGIEDRVHRISITLMVPSVL